MNNITIKSGGRTFTAPLTNNCFLDIDNRVVSAVIPMIEIHEAPRGMAAASVAASPVAAGEVKVDADGRKHFCTAKGTKLPAFSDEEKSKCIAAYLRNEKRSDIARAIGRSPQAVKVCIRKYRQSLKS